MRKFTHGTTAQTAHQAILASLQTMENARQNAVLWFADIKKRRLYRELGYPSMNMYAKQALGFSETRASDFSRLADKLEQLPLLRGALEKDEIGYTKANQVAQVSTVQNEAAWLAEARTSSRRELADKIKQARRKARDEQKGQSALPIPDRNEKLPAAVVSVRQVTEFSPEQYARHEALLEKIEKSGGRLPANRAEALLELLASYLAQIRTSESKNSRRRKSAAKAGPSVPDPAPAASPPFQIHLHRCPDCARATVQTGRGELAVSPATAARAACDARVARADADQTHADQAATGHADVYVAGVSTTGARNTATIPPRTRRQVLARDRHRCRRPGCSNTRFLEVHHLVPRSRGGGNEPENLVTLCAACHQLAHEGKWDPGTRVEGVRERAPAYGRRRCDGRPFFRDFPFT